MATRPGTLSAERRRLLARRLGGGARTGYALVVDALLRVGITHVFGVSGSPVRPVFIACAEAGIRICTVHNQQAAVLMAASFNYRMGATVASVLVSAGPAVTNAVTGMLVARDNCWPVVVIGGCRPKEPEGFGWFQDLDAVPIMEPITKWAIVIRQPGRIAEGVVEAHRRAASGRPGPVYVELPEDVLSADCPIPRWEGLDMGVEDPPIPAADEIARAARLLSTARRPLVVAGKGIRWGDAHRVLGQLVDRLGLPFVASPMGRGLLSDAHPRCLNPVLGQAQADADTVLLVGARMDWVFQFGGQLHADARIIQIDIEPGEIGRNRAAEIGLVGDAAATLQSLLTAVEQSAPVPESPIDRDWLNALLSERAARLMDLRRLTSDTRLPVRPHCLVAEIRDAVPDDTVFVVDGNVIMAAAEESLPSHIPLGRMTAGHNGCMGVGLPFALAAKLHDPDRPVVLICGDYAFSLAALELETAARNQLPVVVVIANNGGAAGALYDHPAFNGVVTTYHPVAHYERIATAFGGIGESIDTPAQIAPAIRRALEANRPTCLNVTVDPHAPLVGR